MKAFRKKVKKNRIYREYVDVINGKLQLSHREADVLATLLQLNREWGTMVKDAGNILSTDVRRVLMRETRITKTNLARYTTALKKKGVLVDVGNGNLQLNETFIPEFDEKGNCEVMFILDVV